MMSTARRVEGNVMSSSKPHLAVFVDNCFKGMDHVNSDSQFQDPTELVSVGEQD